MNNVDLINFGQDAMQDNSFPEDDTRDVQDKRIKQEQIQQNLDQQQQYHQPQLQRQMIQQQRSN